MVKNFYQDTSKKLLIIGCGGHSKVVTDVAKEVGFRKILYKDINLSKKEFLGEKVLQDDIKNYTDYFFVAIGDNFVREKVYMNFHQKNKNSIAATLIHPSSVISKNCSIGVTLSKPNLFSKIYVKFLDF